MEKQLPRVYLAVIVATLLFAPVLIAEAQMKPGASVKTLTLGLVFYGPREPVEERFRPLVEYAGRKLSPAGDTKCTVIIAPSAMQLLKLIDEGRVDFYLESPYPTYVINRSGAANILLRRWKSGMSEYRSVIFTSKESGIAQLSDLRGKMIAFEDAGSTSGYFLPKLWLFQKRFLVLEKPGLEAKVPPTEIGYIFATSVKNIVNLVVQQKVAAGAISNDDYANLDDKRKPLVSILSETESLPRHLVSVRRDLPEPVVKRLKDILLSMHEDGEGQKILRQTDNTTKFDLLPGGEEGFRRKLMELYRPRQSK